MKQTVRGTYKTTHWNEQGYSQVEQGPRLTVAEKELTLEGGVRGTAIGRSSVLWMTDGSNRFAGHACITARIGDREGSFVVEEIGTGNAEGASGSWKIVAGSAAGDLAGVKGAGSWTWEMGSESVAYKLTYEF